MKRMILLVIIFPFGFLFAQEKKSAVILHVKFEDGLDISAHSGKLIAGTGSYPGTTDLEQVGHWEPFYSIPAELLKSYYEKARKKLKKNLSDPGTLFEFRLKPGTDLLAVKRKLEKLQHIQYVSIPPKLTLPNVPDFRPLQTYLTEELSGIHAEEFWSTYNNHGSGVKICDVEYQFNANHADLPPVTIIGPEPLDPDGTLNKNHGTAVLGEIASLNDGVGTTGIAYESELFFAGAYVDSTLYLEEALISTLQELGEGDVVLIELQIYMGFEGTSGNGQHVPLEWYKPYYDAIQLISGNGIIVVEAAGNGSMNLDDPIFSVDNNGHHPFLQENWSEAIMVGAGAVLEGSNTPRSRLALSNYGSRLDVQGNGEGVMTTGYGIAYSAEGPDHFYTNAFSGTSSASPIVAGAVALLQSLHKQQTGFPLSTYGMRNLLVSTGKPQVAGGPFPVTEKIGPLPNVFAAANKMMDELGIEQIEKDGFSIYPNPSKGSFEVYVPNQFVQELKLRDLTGKEIPAVYTKTQMGFECLNGNLAPGMYHLSVIYTDGTLVTKSVQIAD